MAFALQRDDDQEFRRHLRESTSVGRQVVAKITDEKTTGRAAAIARLSAVRAEAVSERGSFEKAFAGAQVAVKQAEQALKTALDAARQVLAAHDNARFSSDREIQHLETELTDTAPAAISDFVRWTSDEHHRTLQLPLTEETALSDEINPTTGRKIVLLKTNARSIAARAKALLDAKSIALELSLTVAAPGEIADRLAQLRAGVPSV